MEDLNDNLFAFLFACFVFVWAASYFANNWLWSGNPFDEEKSKENARRVADFFLSRRK